MITTKITKNHENEDGVFSQSSEGKILFADESYRVMGACFEVYKEKGNGFWEDVYQECLKMEFEQQGIPHVEQPRLNLKYKGHPLKSCYEPDFVCFGKIILEIKAVKHLGDEMRAQVFNYLKSTGLRLGLLVNFGFHPKIQHERIVL